MHVAVIGYGKMGKKRAELARKLGDMVTKVFDKGDAIDLSGVDAAVICTDNKSLSEVATSALYQGKHVFVEKPCGLNLFEVSYTISAAKAACRAAYAGMTLRHHPGISCLRTAVRECTDIYSMRAVYGHGRRGQLEGDWRTQPGGGELLDQGTHLIDLAQCLLGPHESVLIDAYTSVPGRVVDDNAHIYMTGALGWRASLHASWTEWAPTFRVELSLDTGKHMVEGLGGAYGLSRYKHYSQYGEFMRATEFERANEVALENEWLDFKRACETGSRSSMENALNVMEAIEDGL